MSRWQRKVVVSLAAMSLGLTTQLTGCGEFFALAGVTGVNFCSILNCEGGTFFDFCGTNPVLIDCPNAVPVEGDGAGDDAGAGAGPGAGAG